MFTTHTLRLSIAPCRPTDTSDMADVLKDERVMLPFYIGRPASRTIASDCSCSSQPMEAWNKDGIFRLAARQRGSERFVGGVFIAKGYFSYFVAPDYWAQGFGFEMVSASLAAAPMLGLQRLTTSVVRENFASRRILEKCGFRFAGLTSHRSLDTQARMATLRYQLEVVGG